MLYLHSMARPLPLYKQPSRGMALQSVTMLWNDYRGILHELEIAANMHATPVLETTEANRGTHSLKKESENWRVWH